jgi:hypothetical protein
MQLRESGLLSIVCPVVDDGDLAGIGIFNLDEAKTREVMDGDPAVQAGILISEVHVCRGFPLDALPA